MTAKVEKSWTLRKNGNTLIVGSPAGDQTFFSEVRARAAIRRKMNATLAAWKRSGWTEIAESVTEGDPETFTVVGMPPCRDWVSITLRISKDHKADIEAEARDRGVSEAEVISDALNRYFTT